MDLFAYHDGRLQCEDVTAQALAGRYGTPLYVYSAGTLLDHYDRLKAAFAPCGAEICFSVKSCQNVNICRLLAERGSGFDVVSGGELHRALLAGAEPAKIVFAGVGKTDNEIRRALAARIGLFNVESESELGVLAELAGQDGHVANVALRVNPNVDARTHAYTTTGKKETKFGVDREHAVALLQRFQGRSSLALRGLHLHIGSPVNAVEPYVESIKVALELIDELAGHGITIDTLDIGGGFGAHYEGNEAPPMQAYADAIVPLLQGRQLRIVMEPGRALAANAGILLSRVLHVKSSGTRRFVIVDAAITDLIRPALYDAYHFIWPADAGEHPPVSRLREQPLEGLEAVDVVGPVCESGDFLARGRRLPPLQRGDLLAVFTTGAYAMTMASQYNSRPRAAEVLVTGGDARLIRRRETYDDLVAAELV